MLVIVIIIIIAIITLHYTVDKMQPYNEMDPDTLPR